MIQQEDIAKWLTKIPLFKELSKEELIPFVKDAQTRFYKRKMFVFMEGEQFDRVFCIYDGKVKIYKTDFTGKEYVISVLEPGDMFPYVGFYRNENYHVHAEVLEDTHLIVIPKESFEEMFIFYPKLFRKIFKALGDKITDLQERLAAQIFHNTYEQIILLLIRLCQSNGKKMNSGYKLTTRLTNKELANMLGTSRETVSRTMNQLKRKEYIFLNEDGFYFINQDSLKQELFP